VASGLAGAWLHGSWGGRIVIRAIEGTPGTGMTYSFVCEPVMSEQARYLMRCIDMWRAVSRSGRSSLAADWADVCRREAGYLISGDCVVWNQRAAAAARASARGSKAAKPQPIPVGNHGEIYAKGQGV